MLETVTLTSLAIAAMLAFIGVLGFVNEWLAYRAIRKAMKP